jgi:hypothetical protein
MDLLARRSHPMMGPAMVLELPAVQPNCSAAVSVPLAPGLMGWALVSE